MQDITGSDWLLTARASEQGNVIGSVRIYMYWLGKNHNHCPQDEQALPSSKQVSSSGKMPEALPSQTEEH